MTAEVATPDNQIRGRALRKAAPRASHAAWLVREPSERDPVAILQAHAQTRVPELVPIRYGRMLVSPFTFYRGAAAIMAADLAETPSAGLTVQLCGDAHLANFGGFAAPDRSLVFDLNDFDETLPGPFEWDLKRLVTSFVVAGRARGFSAGQRGDLVREVSRTYREAMREFAAMSRLDVWYARMDGKLLGARYRQMADAKTLARLRRRLDKAEARTHAAAFSRYTTLDEHGNLRPISDPPLVVPIEQVFEPDVMHLVYEVIEKAIDDYRQTLPHDRQALLEGYRMVGVARKVVGVGSVGTRCWIVLTVAEDDPMDDLVLQVKEAVPSVLEPYLGASRYEQHGQRVVEGQRLMQAASDVLLGWQRIVHPDDGQERHFYVRQMWDGKVSANTDKMTLKGYTAYAGICGWTLARAHARSGDRKAVAGYLGSGVVFDEALVRFAESYADQNDADYALLQEAAAQGRIPVENE
jgi:uncharacterized protein (DUF2252 family)